MNVYNHELVQNCLIPDEYYSLKLKFTEKGVNDFYSEYILDITFISNHYPHLKLSFLLIYLPDINFFTFMKINICSFSLCICFQFNCLQVAFIAQNKIFNYILYKVWFIQYHNQTQKKVSNQHIKIIRKFYGNSTFP